MASSESLTCSCLILWASTGLASHGWSLVLCLPAPGPDTRCIASPSYSAGFFSVMSEWCLLNFLGEPCAGLGLPPRWQGWNCKTEPLTASPGSAYKCSGLQCNTALFFLQHCHPILQYFTHFCNKYNRRAAYSQRGRETKWFNIVKLEQCHQMRDGKGEGQ